MIHGVTSNHAEGLQPRPYLLLFLALQHTIIMGLEPHVHSTAEDNRAEQTDDDQDLCFASYASVMG